MQFIENQLLMTSGIVQSWIKNVPALNAYENEQQESLAIAKLKNKRRRHLCLCIRQLSSNQWPFKAKVLHQDYHQRNAIHFHVQQVV